MNRRTLALTAVGRITVWFAVLFTLGATSMALGSYGLVRRAFDNTPALANDPFGQLGLQSPSPEAVAALRTALGANAPQVIQAAIVRAQNNVLDELARRSVVSLILTSVVAVFGAWWVANRSLRPVRRLTTLARGISVSNLHDRIDLAGPNDEIKALADTFDGMLARLEQAFVAQRLFAAHVSHELRTPLATLRAEADLVAANAEATETERRLAEAARIAVERSDRLITSLLALSRAESGLADSSPVDLADITGAVVSDLTAAADTARVEVDLKLADASVTGDEVLLRSLVENLVRNAITYNYPDGTVSVSVETRDGAAILRVENSGPALTAADVARLTEPFVRGTDSDLARPGVGIGTAVVQAVASAHHGTFTAQARAGGGLRATVTLRQD